MLKQNKLIFLSTLPRTGFNTEACSCFSLSQLDCDTSRECPMPEVDQLMMYHGVRAMPDNDRGLMY